MEIGLLNSRTICFVTMAILSRLSFGRRARSFSTPSAPFQSPKAFPKTGIDLQSEPFHHRLNDLTDSVFQSTLYVNLTSIPLKKDIHSFHQQLYEKIESLKKEKDQSVSVSNSVNIMINLYNFKSGKLKFEARKIGKLSNVLKKSDIIRCFEAVDFYKEDSKWNVVFDTSAISPHERIRMAELRVSVSEDEEEAAASLVVWDERRSYNDNEPLMIRRKIGNIKTEMHTPTVSTDMTKIVRRWHSSNNKKSQSDAVRINTEFEDATENQEENLKSSKHAHFKRSLPASLTLPYTMLFVYSTNKNIELYDVASARQSRNKRSSKRNHSRLRAERSEKHAKRKNRKRNKTEKVAPRKEIRHNEVEIVFPPQKQQVSQTNSFIAEKEASNPDKDDLARWRQEQSNVIVIEDKLPKHPPPQKQPKQEVVLPAIHFGTGNEFQASFPSLEPRHCRKVDYFIDFEKIGWGDWIIFPKRYNAYKCVGECRVPLIATNKPTNHAFMQSLLSVNRPESGIHSPCCVPSKLIPLSILYYEDGVVKQREHEDMIVDECDCR